MYWFMHPFCGIYAAGPRLRGWRGVLFEADHTVVRERKREFAKGLTG